MKKYIKQIATALAALTLFAGCSSVSTSKNEKAGSENICNIKVQIADTYSRTAMPSIAWDDYNYELNYIKNYGETDVEAEKTLFSGKTKEQIASSTSIETGKYRFTLNAYKNTLKVLSGVVDVTLTQSTALSFKMLPVSGSTGTAKVTVNLPAADSTIAAIKVARSDTISKTLTAASQGTVDTLTITGSKAEWIETDLPSNTRQYGIFYFLDAQGSVVLTRAESLLIVGGCVSSSTIDVKAEDYHTYAAALTLKKDGAVWTDSGYALKLKNQTTGKEYVLSGADGVFTASVAEGTYDLYIDGNDSGFDFNSADQTADVSFYTANLSTIKGITLTYVSGAVSSSDNDYYVLEGNSFVFKANMADGYQKNNFKVMVNGATQSTDLNTNITVSDISSGINVTVSGAETVTYTITYNHDGTMDGSYTAPGTYTVEDTVALPTSANLKKNGKVLDGWKVSGSEGPVFASITPGSRSGNLVLDAVWKDSASVDTINKVIYANGINLLIFEEGDATNVCVDLNGNGIRNTEDYLVTSTGGVTDFTGYTLKAGNAAGTPIASDFKFTMTGGFIKDIWGLENSTNKSILDISGTAKIGSVGESYTDPATQLKYNYDVHGVHLSTITDNWVTLSGKMSGDYNVTLITEDVYEPATPHYVAKIGNSEWAAMDKFTCYKKTTEVLSLKSQLAMKTIDGIGLVIRLANPNAIALPDPNSTEASERPVGDVEDVVNGFTLGGNRIATECSVFSIAVENGTFEVGATTIPGGSTYLAQPTATTYEESLSTGKRYIYMHVLSDTNQLSSEDASEFLESVVFRRNEAGTPITVKINLETVPAAYIKAKEVSYFNGSFYKGVKKSSAFAWDSSYNEAKSEEMMFNGLKGYLGNFTSLVEYNYISGCLGLGYSWCGGARLDNRTTYDTDTVADGWDSNGVTVSPDFRWQAGPEAGQLFTTGKYYKVQAVTYKKVNNRNAITSSTKSELEPFANKTVELRDASKKVIATGTLGSISSTGTFVKTYYIDVNSWSISETPAFVNLTDEAANYGNCGYITTETSGYTNWASGEPNDSWKGKSEQCVHFYPKTENNGTWNDYGYNNGDVKAYIIEYTPYENAYTTCEANYQSIKREQNY